MPKNKKRISEKVKRAALYVRVSTEEQALRGVSLEAQRERLLAYAAENGLSVAGLYCDEGISARKRYTGRPELLRMLSDVRAGRIDVILFIKLDRWFRSIADYYEIQTILDAHGVGWIATEEDYDTTTANGRLSLNVRLAIAQDESDRTSERIKFVFENMVKDGRVISGSTPLGFFIQDKRLAINEDEAAIVRSIFETFVECRSPRETADRIARRFGRRFSPQVIRDMLANTRYVGEAYGVSDYCPPIVEPTLFRKAGEILALRSPRSGRRRGEIRYPFRGVLFCGVCGKPLSAYTSSGKRADGTPRKSFSYYRCPDHLLGRCDASRQWNGERLEEELLLALSEEIQRSEWQIRVALIEKKETPSRREEILRRMERLKELYLAELLPRELYEREYVPLRDALAREDEVPPPSLGSASFDDLYHGLTTDQRKAFWAKALSRITLFPDGRAAVRFS